MKLIPHRAVRKYSEAMFQSFLKDRLQHSLADRIKPLMEQILTEYLCGWMEDNQIKHCYEAPILVKFGAGIEHSYICASECMMEKYLK